MSCNNEHEMLKKFAAMDKAELREMAISPFMSLSPIQEPKQRQSPWEIYGIEKPTCNSCGNFEQKFMKRSVCRFCSQFYQDLHTSKGSK